MKTMRQKYFESYERVEVPADNKRGFTIEYRYKADWYAWDLTDEGLRRRKVTYILTEVVGIVLYFAAALQKSAFNTIDLAAGFAVASLVCWIAELWGVSRFCTARQPMTINDFNEIREFIIVGSGLRFMLLLLATVSGLFFLVKGGQTGTADLFSAAGHLGSGICSLLICRLQNHCRWRLFRNENGQVGAER